MKTETAHAASPNARQQVFAEDVEQRVQLMPRQAQLLMHGKTVETLDLSVSNVAVGDHRQRDDARCPAQRPGDAGLTSVSTALQGPRIAAMAMAVCLFRLEPIKASLVSRPRRCVVGSITFATVTCGPGSGVATPIDSAARLTGTASSAIGRSSTSACGGAGSIFGPNRLNKWFAK